MYDSHDDTQPQLPFYPPLMQEPAPKPRRRWLAPVACGLAGGLLAASIAVPATLWIDRNLVDNQPAASAQQAPQIQLPDFSQLPQGEQQLPGSGAGNGSAGLPTGGTETNATEEQSQGVVLVNTVLNNGEGAGTGMVLDSDGLILTNYHVVENSTSIKVTVATTGETYAATVVGDDETHDVALIKIDASDLTTVKLDQDAVDVDDSVLAVGNGSGQGFLSAAPGTVVAEDQSITASDGSGSPLGSEKLTGLIESSAAVVPGYSGGPLFDSDGEVIGINTAASTEHTMTGAVTSTGQAYTIPIANAMAIVDQIKSGDESGTVNIGPKAYLGIAADARSSQAVVGQVIKGEAAAAAGLAAGDTITGLDDQPISSFEDLVAALGEHEPGDQVTLSWTTANGQQQQATVTLGSDPAN